MDPRNYKKGRFSGCNFSSPFCKFLASVILLAFVIRAILLPTLSFNGLIDSKKNSESISNLSFLSKKDSNYGTRKDKFLEVPQIIWGLNNQKIAFARACLTARMLNRTLLMPSLSASLFYKELDQLKPISFDKVFELNKFNSLCNGFVRLGHYSEISNRTGSFELRKGSGRRWTIGRDFDQLREFMKDPYDKYEVIRVIGKNPFLWHDHWPVKDYARLFECLVLVDEFAKEADKVISRIQEVGKQKIPYKNTAMLERIPYVAVHMRIEKDWMIHCKKLEQRYNITQICSSQEEIVKRVKNIPGLSKPMIVYVAVADSLLENGLVLSGWDEGLIPFEKKKLGVSEIYEKYPYLIKSAIDYEVCLRADIFVGNSFSTFSSLIALERTQKRISSGGSSSCGNDVRWGSYAYNIEGDLGGPQRWVSNMSDTSLQAISYGSNHISC